MLRDLCQRVPIERGPRFQGDEGAHCRWPPLGSIAQQRDSITGYKSAARSAPPTPTLPASTNSAVNSANAARIAWALGATAPHPKAWSLVGTRSPSASGSITRRACSSTRSYSRVDIDAAEIGERLQLRAPQAEGLLKRVEGGVRVVPLRQFES
jgi:hypothetical protein